jgi:hypothetical protein
MFSINVKANVKPAVDHLNRIAKNLGDKALTSALNKTMAQVRTQMIRGITAEYAIKAADVRERLQLRRASRRGMQFTATLIGNPAGRAKRAMNVIRFLERSVSLAQARKRRKSGTLGVLRFKIRRAGGLQTIKGAFISNNGRTVFRRTGKARLPIEAVQTIGVPQMFQAKKVQIPVQRWITANFPIIFRHEMAYFLSTVR